MREAVATKRLRRLATALLTLDLLCACGSPKATDGERHYDLSADVPMRRWTTADTLFYPLTVNDEPEVRTPMMRGHDYAVSYSVRMSAAFPLTHVPLTLIVQQTDTVLATADASHVVRNVLRADVALAVRADDGRALGQTWGSLIQHQAMLDSIVLRFDSTGYYRMLLIPDISGKTDALEGIASIGLALHPTSNQLLPR